MEKLFKENGYLSENGELVFNAILDKAILVLLNYADSESELRLIGSLIQKRVGDAVSNSVSKLGK